MPFIRFRCVQVCLGVFRCVFQVCFSGVFLKCVHVCSGVYSAAPAY